MRTTIIEVGDRGVELFFSTRAMINISERSGGDISDLGGWLTEGSTSDKMGKIGVVIADLANGAIIKHNADIALGVEDGQKRPLYPDEYFIDVLNPGDFLKYKDKIFEALNLGQDFEVPENIVIEEKDADLAEIEAEKQKNFPGA